MSSLHSTPSGSRAASPEDENGKPSPQSPTLTANTKQEKHADFKRRSAQAFTVFANEERDRILKTRPDLPMGLVTRMMVDKWRNLDNEAKKPYFDAARTSPPLKAVKSSNDISSDIVPPKKWRPVVTNTQPITTARDQPIRVEQVPEQAPQRVIIVQGKLAPNVVDVPKAPSAISASIAQALGMTIVAPQRTPAVPASNTVIPNPLRTSIHRTKVHAGASSSTAQSLPLSSSSDGQVRSNNTYGFSSSQQALEMFYLALCEPAFPHPNEPPLTPYPANYCYEAYLRMTSGQ